MIVKRALCETVTLFDSLVAGLAAVTVTCAGNQRACAEARVILGCFTSLNVS